jgi:multidrug resistance efflux pump
MKSINFKRAGSDIRVAEENKPKKKKRQWDRIIYFIVFFSLLFGLGYYAFTRLFYVNAQAQVLYENVEIRLLKDARIMEYFTFEDDTIRFGDTLFRYSEDHTDDQSNIQLSAHRSSSDNPAYNWVIREIFTTEEKINSKKSEKEQCLALIKSYKQEVEKIKTSVSLGVLPQSRLDVRENDILKLKSQVQRLESEIAQLYSALDELKTKIPSMHGADSASISANMGDVQNEKFFLSPFEGTVNRIFVRQFETSLKSETILSLHRNSPIFVRAFFDQSDIDVLQPGDEFVLEFPDGTESIGVLKRFYYSTVPLPVEFQKRYEPITRTIGGDIYPKDSTQAALWKNFYKMNVVVKKFKF